METHLARIAALALLATGAGASIAKAKARLALLKAKHRSLAGHSRMSRRIAAQIPFYEYDEHRFFRSDNPPETVALRRQEGFERLSELFKTRFDRTARETAVLAQSISDLNFTSAYRVPFQYSRLVRTHL